MLQGLSSGHMLDNRCCMSSLASWQTYSDMLIVVTVTYFSLFRNFLEGSLLDA